MIELDAEDFASANPLLDELSAGAEIIGAVLSGHTKGKVFLRTLGDPQVGFVYDNGFCVLAGVVADVEFAKNCLNWLHHYLEQDFFVLYPGHDSWIPALDAVAAASVEKVGRIIYRFGKPTIVAQHLQGSLPADFTLARMDAALMSAVADTLYPWIRGMWKSEIHFERHGLGFCVLTQGRVVSLCYSSFVSGLHREIDILTAEPYRRHGLAKAAASAYIQECLEQGLQPGWNCFKDNRPSRELARVLGFVPVDEFPVYSWNRMRNAGNEA